MKAVIATVALGAVGIATSMADPVYSANVVGFVNVTVHPTWNLIANPLNGTNNTLSTILPSAPNGAYTMGWNSAAQAYTVWDAYLDAANSPDGVTPGWYNNDTGNPSTTTYAPGSAFFYFNPPSVGTTTLTFVGEVPQVNLTSSIAGNYSLGSALVPSSPALTSANGFPAVDGMFYQTFNGVDQTYSTQWWYLNALNSPDGGVGWYDNDSGAPVTPTPAPGVGYFIFNPGVTLQWNMTFNVQ